MRNRYSSWSKPGLEAVVRAALHGWTVGGRMARSVVMQRRGGDGTLRLIIVYNDGSVEAAPF